MNKKSNNFNSRGVAFFKEKKYSDALTCFDQAIKQDPTQAHFYANRAQVYFALKNYQATLDDSIEGLQHAVRFSYDDTTCTKFQALAIYHIGEIEEAIEILTEYIECHDNADIHLLRERLINEKFGIAPWISVENDFEYHHKDFAKLDKFMIEFAASGATKDDVSYIHSLLDDADCFVCAEKVILNQPSYDAMHDRWGEDCHDIEGWICDYGKPGDLKPETDGIVGQDAGYFRNQPFQEIQVFPGRNHVSLESQDLSHLLNLHLENVKGWNKSNPITFVEINTSHVVSLKMLIILEMIKINAKAKSILQVWYSMGWTETTRREFFQAVRRLRLEEHDKDVTLMLHVIVTMKGTLEDIRDIWRKKISLRDVGVLSNLSKRQDRIDYCKYLCTGDVCGGDDITSPNVVFLWQFLLLGVMEVGKSTKPSFYQTSRYDTIQPGQRIMQYLETSTLTAIGKLITATQEKTLILKVISLNPKQDMTTYEDCALDVRVKSLNPAVLIWGTASQTGAPSDFHLKVYQLNSDHTLHYCQSNQWMNEMFGTVIIDFEPTVRRGIIDEARRQCKTINTLKYAFNDELDIHPAPLTENHLASCLYDEYVDQILVDMEIIDSKVLEYNPFYGRNGQGCLFIAFSVEWDVHVPISRLVSSQTQLKTCESCKRTIATAKKCGRCELAFYCSRECQNSSWLDHKTKCIPDFKRKTASFLLKVD